MGKAYNRREFLRTSLLSLGTFLVASSPLNVFGTNASSTSSKSFATKIDANLLNKQAKDFFHKKNYSEATNIYQQLISAFPDRISYYDGYARVLGAQQKTLAVAELYRQGLTTNPKSALFMHRLSLRIVDIATGNAKAEKEFANKYGESNLFETASALLLQAISAKKSNKGLYLNLRDIPTIIEKRNEQLGNEGAKTIAISSKTKSDITSTTATYENKWTLSRQSRKPVINENNIDVVVDNITKRSRRELYSTKEKGERENAIKKTKKQHWKFGLEKSIASQRVSLVEKYGTLILEENIYDTDTIGKLRRFYKKNKHQSRMLSLNRYVYLKNNSLANALALAGSLCTYGNNGSDLSEAKELLDTITPYINTLPPVSIAAYYQTSSQICLERNQPIDARKILLEGLNTFNGRGGSSYSLLEKYACSFIGTQNTTGTEMMKAICGKEYKSSDDPVWKFIKLYIDWKTEKDSNNSTENAEKLKPLYALAKLQSTTGSTKSVSTSTKLMSKASNSDYLITKSEIEALRAKIYKL